MVAVVSETEPPIPSTVADLGDVDGVGSGDLLDLTSGLSPGDASTVWLGTFDGAGRFRGWVADPITMPESGTIRLEKPIDDTGASTTTPDTFGFVDCPTVPVSWIVEFEQTCASWESTGLECNDAVDDDEDVDASDLCGCASGAGAAWSIGPLLALLIARGRRARTAIR
jgi:hypothetical protein